MVSWPWVTVYDTRYVTRYRTNFVGVVTKYFTVEEVMDDEGNVFLVTKVVSAITNYFDNRGAVVRDIRDIAREKYRYVNV